MSERSVGVNKKRVRINKPKYKVVLKRNGFNFKKSQKINILKHYLIGNQSLRVVLKTSSAVSL